MNQYKDQEQDQEQDETTNLEAEAVDLQGEPDLISDLDRVMRLLRRRPRGAGHGGGDPPDASAHRPAAGFLHPGAG